MSTLHADHGWDARIERATQLAAHAPAAAELLTFYARLAALQQSLLPPGTPRAANGQSATVLATRLDLAAIAAAIPRLLAWLVDHAPAPLATAAVAMTTRSGDEWTARVSAFVSAPDEAVDPHEAFVVEAACQPFMEMRARMQASGSTSPPPADGARCPCCRARPSLGVLREAGHGARRSLLCGVCLSEWPAPRIGCVACGEAQFERLPVYRADEFPAARIDACDSCQTYLKAIDFTRDGHAVPVVDDLATVSLDLWAREQGYRRMRPHLLGV